MNITGVLLPTIIAQSVAVAYGRDMLVLITTINERKQRQHQTATLSSWLNFIGQQQHGTNR